VLIAGTGVNEEESLRIRCFEICKKTTEIQRSVQSYQEFIAEKISREMPQRRFHFKPVDREHRTLVHHWLKEPHVAKWFYGQGLENTLRHLDEFLEGASFAQYWLAYDKNHPFAFFITSSVSKPTDELTRWCSKEGEAIALDMLIGDLNYLGKGLSHGLIREFLTGQFPQVSEVLIDPEATNSHAIYIYKKVGFRVLGEFIPSHSPHLHYMMRLDMQKLLK
jgi:hypothetical protein